MPRIPRLRRSIWPTPDQMDTVIFWVCAIGAALVLSLKF
jgi:hypothetical protein